MTAPVLTSSARRRGAAAGRADPPVVAEGLTRTFGGVTVVADLDVVVHPGEIHALIGANGAGKSTVVRMLAGLSLPSAGRVRICGDPPAHRQTRARIGLLPSTDRGFYLRLSAAENLRFFGRLQGLPRTAIRRRVPEVLEQVGLVDVGRQRTGLFSRGMLRRLAVARALMAEPPVLLLDEATHDLDPLGSQQVRAAVAASGAATVWATQRLEELQGFADTVSVLAAGRQRYNGSLRDLVVDGDRRFVITLSDSSGGPVAPEVADAALDGAAHIDRPATGRGSPDDLVLVVPAGNALGRAVARLDAAGLQVHSAAPERPDVERALMRIVEHSGG